MIKKIIHCDADCFFAALEIRDDKELKGLPVAVGGSPSRRGVISTCNYEARAFGVRSAMASAQAKRLCPQLIILPHSMDKYRTAAMQMRSIFLDYTEVIQPVSLDEAYLDVSESHHCLGSATLIAKDIRRRIKKEIGITVSAGVAGNKFLAKVASDWEKPDGLTVITPDRERFFLKQLPVSVIPGVGPVTLAKLSRLGISTCNDLQHYSLNDLYEMFGQFGHRLFYFARGEDDREVETSTERLSLSVEQTYNEDLVGLEACYPLLRDLLERLKHRLDASGREKSVSKCFIKLKFNDFERTSLEVPAVQVTSELTSRLLEQAWNRFNKPVRLMGVGVRFTQQESDTRQLSFGEFDSSST